MMELLRYAEGNIPVIITSLHGGSLSLPDVNIRTCIGVPATCSCSVLKDSYTKEITERVISRLKNIYGTPYVVISDIHRKYIDLNRIKSCAYEDANAERYYDSVYNRIKKYVSILRATYNTSYLFDIHGTSGVSIGTDVYIGTLNGNSVNHLLTSDKNALERLRMLFTYNGYKVQPSVSGEKEALQGENIIRTFGSHKIGGIDSFQIEIVKSIRYDYTLRTKFTDNLACIIKDFVKDMIKL